MSTTAFQSQRLLLALALVFSAGAAASASPGAERTQAALANLQNWLGDNENADRWRQFLKVRQLEEQLAAGEQADTATLSSVFQQFDSGESGLELRRFADVRNALGAWRSELLRDLELPELVRASRDNFAPVTAAEVADARQQVATRARELEQFLAPGSSNSEAWKRYLGWESLESQLAEGAQPDRERIETLVDRLTANEVGLELPSFQNLARALERYQALSAVQAVENQSELYAAYLDGLAVDLDKYAEQPSSRLSHTIGQRLGNLAMLGQSPELVYAVRRQYARPNFYLEATSSFLSRAASRDVNDVAAVRDCIMETSISGTATTRGRLTLRTLPSEDRARFLLVVNANTHANTVGVNGPAVICSTSDTNFTSNKIIEITDPSFWVFPAQVDATTHSNPYSVQKRGGGIGSRLVSRIASRRVAESKGQAERIASRRAEDRVGAEMNDEVMREIREARDRYSDEFRKPLLRRNAFPELIRYSSTDSVVAVEALQATRDQLGAATAPPASPDGHDIALRMNQTAVENALAVMLGGTTLSQDDAAQDPELDRKIPDWLQDLIDERQAEEGDAADENFQPWSITFRRNRPISVAFGDNQITTTVHATRITTGDETYDGWDLIAVFTPHEQNGQITLIREGEIDVLPTDFDPTAGVQLRRRDLALRNNLSKEINERADRGEGVPEVIDIESIELSEDLQHLGLMWVRRLEPAAGWLTVGLNVE